MAFSLGRRPYRPLAGSGSKAAYPTQHNAQNRRREAATELQSLSRRALDALGESCGSKQVTNGSPVLTAAVEPITFDRFSFGVIRRLGAEVFQPFDGYLGMLIVVPRAVSDEERVFLMQWVKHTAGLVPEAF